MTVEAVPSREEYAAYHPTRCYAVSLLLIHECLLSVASWLDSQLLVLPLGYFEDDSTGDDSDNFWSAGPDGCWPALPDGGEDCISCFADEDLDVVSAVSGVFPPEP